MADDHDGLAGAGSLGTASKVLAPRGPRGRVRVRVVDVRTRGARGGNPTPVPLRESLLEDEAVGVRRRRRPPVAAAEYESLRRREEGQAQAAAAGRDARR